MMKNIILPLIFAASLSACAGNAQVAIAAEQPNVLILSSEHSEHHAVPPSTMQELGNIISRQFRKNNFGVYDKSALLATSGMFHAPKSDAEIVSFAQSSEQPPLDAIVLFTPVINSTAHQYTTSIHLKINGRILNVRTGENIGSYEAALPSNLVGPPRCDLACVNLHAKEKLTWLAQDLGTALAAKARAVSPSGKADDAAPTTAPIGDIDKGLPTAFTLSFSGFNPSEMNAVEEYLVAFSGYLNHRPVNGGYQNIRYWYETKSDIARLNRNLRKMLEHIGLNGSVQYYSGHFLVKKIGLYNRYN